MPSSELGRVPTDDMKISPPITKFHPPDSNEVTKHFNAVKTCVKWRTAELMNIARYIREQIQYTDSLRIRVRETIPE